jgi:hypothetical protein
MIEISLGLQFVLKVVLLFSCYRSLPLQRIGFAMNSFTKLKTQLDKLKLQFEVRVCSEIEILFEFLMTVKL